jgi:hypothetical protein
VPLDVSVVADRYLLVLRAAAARKTPFVGHWPHEVPTEDHA